MKKSHQRILDGGGNYLLQVKGNQPMLHGNLRLLFAEGLTHDCRGVAPTNDWPQLRSAVCVEQTRQVGPDRSTERHYYISSLPGKNAQRMLSLARGHWGIENQLHWRMDVVFHEDDRRIRKNHAAETVTNRLEPSQSRHQQKGQYPTKTKTRWMGS